VTNAPATGTIRFTVELTGSAQASHPDKVRPFVAYNLGYFDGAFGGGLLTLHSGSLGFYPTGSFVSSSIPYTLGVPFNLSGSLSTFASIVAQPYEDPGPITAGIFYQNTAAITGVEVFDSLGNPVPGASLIGEGGNSYPIPEPASLVLAGLALGVLLLRGGH
jgi:hypothetical protein